MILTKYELCLGTQDMYFLRVWYLHRYHTTLIFTPSVGIVEQSKEHSFTVLSISQYRVNRHPSVHNLLLEILFSDIL